MKLYIKNMVCDRCKTAVKSVLEEAGLTPVAIQLGEITLSEQNIHLQKLELEKKLAALGFELIDDKKSRMIEQVKTLIIELVQKKNNELEVNLSEYLSAQLLQEYSSMSNLFSAVEHTTIEKYFILQKIERVKELLVYDELNLSEIALLLNYSSAAHLSNQFKKVTGFSPMYFKKIKTVKRKALDQL